jgi:hypothetical protein
MIPMIEIIEENLERFRGTISSEIAAVRSTGTASLYAVRFANKSLILHKLSEAGGGTHISPECAVPYRSFPRGVRGEKAKIAGRAF